MTIDNWIIRYECFDIHNKSIAKGKARNKKPMTEIEAKIKVEKYLKKKYKDFHSLRIISVKRDNPAINQKFDAFKKMKPK